MTTQAAIEQEIQRIKSAHSQNHFFASQNSELIQLQTVINKHGHSPKLASQLEQFLADRWKLIQQGSLPDYTEAPEDEITLLMLKVADFVVDQKNQRHHDIKLT